MLKYTDVKRLAEERGQNLYFSKSAMKFFNTDKKSITGKEIGEDVYFTIKNTYIASDGTSLSHWNLVKLDAEGNTDIILKSESRVVIMQAFKEL